MFDEAKLVAKQTFQAAQDAIQTATEAATQTTGKLSPVAQALADGVDLSDFSCYAKQDETDEDDDEDGSANPEDEPP